MGISAGEVSVKVLMDSSGLTAGVDQAKSSMQGLGSQITETATEANTGSEKIAAGAEQSAQRVQVSTKTQSMSMKDLGLGMTETATSAFGLYRAFDDIEKKQYAVEKAQLANSRAVVAANKAQDDYNAVVEKYGADSDEAKIAQEKLTIAQDAESLTEEHLGILQKSLNDQWLSSAMMVIPSVISGIDGLSRSWKAIKDLGLVEHLKGVGDALKSMGSGQGGPIGGAIAGMGALTFAYLAFTSKSPEMKMAFSILTGALLALAMAQWAENIAAATGLSMTGVGLVLVAAGIAAAAGMYLLSSQYGAQPDDAKMNEAAGNIENTAAAAGKSNSSTGGSSGGGGGGTSKAQEAKVTSTTLFRDINGAIRTREYLSAHRELIRYPLEDVDGNFYDWDSYLSLPDDKRKYAKGGWAGEHGAEMIMVGEGGERELITPESKLGSLGGGSGMIVNNWYIDGSRDVDMVADRVAQKLRDGGMKY